MLYYTFNLVDSNRDVKEKEFANIINSAIVEVNAKLEDKAFAVVSSVLSSGRKLRCCAEIQDYAITVRKIGELINAELDGDYSITNIAETTLSRFDSLVDDAINNDLANRQHPDGLLNSDAYSGVIRRGSARESLIRKGLTKKAALKKATDSWPQVNGLKEELERIFKGKSPIFKGNPVHYVIEAEDSSDRCEIRNLLAACLFEQNRIMMKRITEIKLDTISDTSNEILSGFLDIQNGGIVVVALYKGFDNGDSLNAMHQAMDELVSLIKKKKRNVLFIFEFSKTSEAGWKYIRSLLGEMTFIEIKERNLTNDESISFIDKLAAADNVADSSVLHKLIDESSYSVGDLKNIYSSWYDKHLCSDVYPAYSDISPDRPICIKQSKGTAYQKLSRMIGLDEVRAVITSAIDYARVQSLYEKTGVATTDMTRHMVFCGNPGTAKTTCARLYAQIMKDNGLLSKGQLIEVGRKDIVSKYLGGTAPLIKEYFEKAEGGVLFIDEAYSLVDDRKGLYGDEAINTIVQEMENHRDSVVVILAGYPDEMETFLSRNPGLRSRISFHVNFRDYTSSELLSILKLFISDSGMNLDDSADPKLLRIFETAAEQRDFGNGRFTRNLFEQARLNQASRILHMQNPSDEDIRTLVSNDFKEPERKEQKRQQIGFVME